MIRVTAKDFLKEQSKRYRRQREEAVNVTEEMKQKFQRKPYYMTVGCDKRSDKF